MSRAFINTGVSKYDAPNRGLYQHTHRDEDIGKFRAPTLRNIAVTAPYMHDGSLKTLEDVVEFYDKGGTPNKNLDQKIKALHLTPQDKMDLVAFLNSLSGEGWQNITPPEKFPQ